MKKRLCWIEDEKEQQLTKENSLKQWKFKSNMWTETVLRSVGKMLILSISLFNLIFMFLNKEIHWVYCLFG